MTPGLQLADLGCVAEEEPEVDVLVVRLALGRVDGDEVNAEMAGAVAHRDDGVGRGAGLLGKLVNVR
ncbi:hypothetical protein [Streptomyces sp. NBC_01314]|uniref:hypothetical protein n=1 Tax=Streptomyces sp. NBC_01314 TaxID=2903821 RepID=UPI00308614B2|nr:hypothetical protein OG622_00740 [Streptomyces sp. NBC_01314]